MSRTEFTASLRATGGPANFTGTVLIEPDPTPAEFSAKLAVDAGAFIGAIPVGSTLQIVGIEVEVNDVRIPQSAFTGAYKISLSLRQSLQQWSFETWVAIGGQDAFGNPIQTFGPALGTKNVDIYGIYMVAGVKYRVPQIVRGLVSTDERGGDLRSGFRANYSGFDAAARVQRKTATLVLPFGHGLMKKQVAAKYLALVGETNLELTDNGVQMLRDVQFQDREPIAALNEIFATEDRRLIWNHLGRVTSPSLRAPGPVGIVFNESRIASIRVPKLTAQSDIPTTAIATGNQVERAPDTCGSKTDSIDSDTLTTDQPQRRKFQQGTDCTISSTGLVDPPPKTVPELWTQVVTRLTTRCGVTVQEVIETWGYFAPVASRYLTNGPDLDCTLAYFLGGPPTVRGSEDAAGSDQKWTLISRSTTNHYYNAEGWSLASPYIIAGYASDHFGGDFTGVDNATGTNPRIGYYLGSITKLENFYAIKQALKERTDMDPFATWDTIDYRDDVHVLGSGEGITDDSPGAPLPTYFGEYFQTQGYEFVEKYGSNDGFLDHEKAVAISYGLSKGSKYLYRSGEFAEAVETLRQNAIVVTTYVQDKNANATKKIEVTTDYVEQASGRVKIKKDDLSGGGPVIERLPDVAIEELTNLTDAEIAALIPTKRGKNIPMRVEITAPTLLLSHLPKTVQVQFPWASNPTELRHACEFFLADGAALPINFMVPQNWLVFPGDLHHIRFRQLGIDHDFSTIDVTQESGGLLAPKFTEINGLIYPPGSA